MAGAGAALAVVVAWVVAGCSPSTFMARRMLDAPNRVPEFVKPEGRVWLSWEPGVMERCERGTQVVGSAGIGLRWVRVEPGEYGWRYEARRGGGGGREAEGFHFGFRPPKDGEAGGRLAVGTVYLVHGYGVELETLFPWAVYLAEAGWRAVLVDLPGHGGSGGREVTFGIREVGMLREFREAQERAGGWEGPSVVFGHSMGAALALRWQAEDPGIVGSVALGAYAEFVPAALRLRDDYARWVPRGWVRRAAEKVPGLLGVAPERMDTLHEIRGRGLRAFLVASSDDVVTPPEDSEALRAGLGAGSVFLVVGGATHEALPYAFADHGRRIVEWLAVVAGAGVGREVAGADGR